MSQARQRLDFNRIYDLAEGFRRGELRVHLPEPDTCRSILLGEFHPAPPVMFEYAMGKRPFDFIWTTDLSTVLLHDRLVRLLRDNAVTGWSALPAVVRLKDGSELTGYHALVVHGRCGPRLPDVGPIRYTPTASGRGLVRQRLGLYFDPDTWDGSEFFTPEDTRYILVVERVYRILKKAKPTNVRFDRITEIPYTLEILRPAGSATAGQRLLQLVEQARELLGPCPDWFREAMARVCGDEIRAADYPDWFVPFPFLNLPELPPPLEELAQRLRWEIARARQRQRRPTEPPAPPSRSEE